MIDQLGDIDHAIIAVFFPPNDGGDTTAGVFEHDKRSFGEVEFHDRLFFEEFPKAELLLVDKEGFRLFLDFFREAIEEIRLVVALVEKADRFLIA